MSSSPNLFSSAQCLGYRNERGELTDELCQPTEEIIVKHLRRVLRDTGAKTVFVATDNDGMNGVFNAHFGGSVSFKSLPSSPSDPRLELAILGRANHFVGNCVSSFSAFVKRERDVQGFPSTFFGYPTEKRKKKQKAKTHDPGEL